MVRRIAWLSAILGAVIFAGLAAGLLWSESHIRVPAIAAMVTFAAVVLSYLGGIEGGLSLREEFTNERTRAIALALSTLPSLAAWAVLWLPSPHWQLGAAIGLFLLVWAADLWLARDGLIPHWFVDLRTAATGVVCVILAIAFWLL